MKLREAMRSAGILTALGAPGWLGSLLDAVDVDLPTPPDPLVDVAFPVVLAREPLHVAATVTIHGTPRSARLTIELAALRVQGGAATLSGGSGRLVLAVADSGQVTAELDPPVQVVTLTAEDPDGDGVAIGTSAEVGLALHPSTARLLIVDGAPAVEVDGTLSISGVPGLDDAAELDVRALGWGPTGFSGHVSGAAAVAVWDVGWTGGHDLVPTSLLLDIPLTAVPGLDQLPALEPGCRLRLTGGRSTTPSGSPLDLAAEVLGGPRGIVASSRDDVAAAAVMLTAAAGLGAATDGTTAVAAALSVAMNLVDPLRAHGAARVTRARVDLAAPRRASFDYDASLDCRVSVGGILDLGTVAPLRAVVRGVVVDWEGTPGLDWRSATIDVADPGQWKVFTPEQLLQVDRTRSGTGSAWFEVDLRFALDAGPISLDGATVRVTLPTETTDEGLRITVRGLGARIDVPGLVAGSGSVALGDDTLHADLRASLLPLNLAAAASVDLGPGGSLLASLDVDLPAPVPLASTGLGLFGVGGMIGLDRALVLPEDLEGRLEWDPQTPGATVARDGSSLLGLRVAVGTLPDLGHAFSAVGSLAVGTPDLAVVAALSGRLLGPRPSLVEPAAGGQGIAPRLRGVLAVLPDEVSLAIVADVRFPETAPVLFDGVAPVEARWPVGRPDWSVHLGTDRSRPPGPIRATVLPEILPAELLRAEAFLMIHGDGLTGFPIPTATQGLVVAAGFDIAATMVCIPVVAEIWAGAVVAVSTRPVFLSGRARVGGRLRLGPFALGIDAGLDLQIGPGETYAATMRICGEIDLWFFEISGCVSIALGSRQEPTLAAPDSPLVSASVVDRNGTVLRPGLHGVPVCWPDATLQLGYAPAPAGDPTGSFDVTDGAFARSGEVGDADRYHARYELVRIELVATSGAGPPPGEMAATWQSKPGQHAIAGDGAATLALLSRDPALWTGRLVDGGIRDLSDPVGSRRRECAGERFRPDPGWSLGADGVALDQARWTLPPVPHPGPSSGLHSYVAVRSTQTTWPAVEPLGSTPAGPGGYAWLVPGLEPRRGGVSAHSVQHVGELDLPSAARHAVLLLPDVVRHTSLEIEPDPVRTTLTLVEPMVQAQLVLLSSAELRPGTIETDGVAWTRTALERGPTGEQVSVWAAPIDQIDLIRGVTVHHPVRRLVDERDRVGFVGTGIVGLRGVTRRAFDLAQRVSRGPVFTTPTPVPSVVAPATGSVALPSPSEVDNPLVPGAAYEVLHHWRATYGVGQQMELHDQSLESVLSFEVAGPQPSPPPLADLAVATDVFHPAMLARHLRGYRPSGDLPWFTGDPVMAYLDRSGVTVAHAYGLTPILVVSPTDAPPGSPMPFTDVRLEATDDPGVLTEVERAAVDLMRLGCALPHGPLRLSGTVPLRPQRSYDIALDFTGGRFEYDSGTTRLPSTSFTTSRWGSAGALLAEAGFVRPDPLSARPSGSDVSPAQVVVATRPAVVVDERSDGALLAALRGAAVPALDRPVRTTLLLDPSAATSTGEVLAGLLLEAVEPLLRELTLTGLSLDTAMLADGGFAAGAPTWRRVADRAGTRVLFVPSGPPGAGVVRLTWQTWGVTQQGNLAAPDDATTHVLLSLAGAPP